MLIKQIVMKTIVTNSIFKCIIPYSKLGKFWRCSLLQVKNKQLCLHYITLEC